jgi:hypothetical protein
MAVFYAAYATMSDELYCHPYPLFWGLTGLFSRRNLEA